MTNATGAQTIASDFHRDHEILKQIMRGFEAYMKPFAKKESYGVSKLNLFDLLWRSILSYSIRDNQPVRAPRAYSHHDFIGLEERRGGLFGRFRSPRPLTLTAALQDYLTRLPRRPLNDDYNKVADRLRAALAPLPTLKQERGGRLTNAPFRHTVVTPLRHKTADRKEATTSVSLPVAYKPSFVGSAMTSFLLGGVSRIAIMAALGATGAPVIAGAVLAGVGAGAVTSYYKNRALIAQEVAQEKTFGGRMKARWRGFTKSYSWKQLALNTATSTAGVVGGGALFEAVAENVPMPKLVQDFAAAAKSQMGSALEWTSEKAAFLTATLGGNAGAVRAGVSSLRDMIGMNDVAPTETTGVVPVDTQTAISTETQSDIPVRRVQTISIPADGIIETPVVDPATRIEQAFADVAPLTVEEQQAAEMLRQNFADKTAMFTDPAPVTRGVIVTDQTMSYVGQDVPVKSAAEQAIAAAAPVPVETVTIGRGDSLWKLTREYYGLASTDGEGRWDAIAKIVQANPHLAANPSALTVGETLIMPDLNDPNVSAANCNVVGGKLRGGCKLSMG